MANALMSGQITVAAAGTAVQGTDAGVGYFEIKGLIANTNNVYVGQNNDEDVTSSNGYELDAGQTVRYYGPLNRLWFDVDTNGEGVSWLRVG